MWAKKHVVDFLPHWIRIKTFRFIGIFFFGFERERGKPRWARSVGDGRKREMNFFVLMLKMVFFFFFCFKC